LPVKYLKKRINLFIAATALLAYLAIFVMVVWTSPSYSFYTGDQGLKYLQIKAIVEQGPLNPALPQKPVPQEALDLVMQDAMTYEHEGATYSVYSNMSALVIAPFYWLAGYPGLFILPFFSVVGCVILIGWLIAHLGYGYKCSRNSLLIILGSPIAVYGLVLWEHAQTAFLCCVALTLLLACKKRGAIFLAGLSIGFACCFRPESLIFGLALALSLLLMRIRSNFSGSKPHKKLGLTILKAFSYMGGILVGYLPQIILDYWISGFLFSKHITMQASGSSKFLLPEQIDTFYSFCVGIFNYLVWGRLYYIFNVFLGDLWPTITFCLVAALLGRILLKKASPQLREKWTALLLTVFLTAGVAFTLWRHINDGVHLPEKNFWFTFPAAAGVLMLVFRSDHQDDHLRFLIFTSIFVVLLKILIFPLGSGVQWGFRLMLPVALPLAVIVAIGMERTKTWLCRKVLFILLAVSLIVQTVAIKNIVSLRKQMAAVPAKLEQLTEPGDVVITPYIHLYQICPTLYSTRGFLWIKPDHNIEPIIDALSPETKVCIVAIDKEYEWPQLKQKPYRLSQERIGLGWANVTFRRIERHSGN